MAAEVELSCCGVVGDEGVESVGVVLVVWRRSVRNRLLISVFVVSVAQSIMPFS